MARAPEGKEVEDLQKKEIIMALRKKMPADQAKNGMKNINLVASRSPSRDGPDIKGLLTKLMEVKGSLSAKLLDGSGKEITEVEIKDLINTLSDVKPETIVLDGIITQRLVDAANKAGVQALVGVNKATDIKNTYKVQVVTEHNK